MNAKDYEFLVYRLEAASRENPASFRVSVALVSGLAYTVLSFSLRWACCSIFCWTRPKVVTAPTD
jgi:hypothetical protein